MGRFREFVKRVPLVRRAFRWGRGWAARIVSVRVDDHTILATVDGLKMYLDSRDTELTPHLALGGTWEPAVTRGFLDSLREGMTVVDVGANVGYFTLLAARAVGPTGKVFAFEPEPRNFELLARSIEANGFSRFVVLSHNAVSDRVGTAPFHIFPESYGGSHSFFSGGAPKHITVETTSLDAALGPSAGADVVKVDVEGAEPLVFRGMREMMESSPSLVIIMEFTPVLMLGCGPDAPARMLKEVREAGFSLNRFTEAGDIEAVDEETLLGSPLETLFLKRRQTR